MTANVLSEEVRYKLLKAIETNPEMSQRDVARELGISLGKVNYCLKALVGKGWIRASDFKNRRNKRAYMYLLTPRGVREKARATVQFLQIKTRDYEALRAQIRQMRREAKGSHLTARSGIPGAVISSTGPHTR